MAEIDHYIERVKTLDPSIHAFLDFDEPSIRAQQLNSSTAQEAKTVAIKDNMVTLERPTTAASKILEGFISPYEATVITRLKEEGYVLFGKTNLDEFAMGSSTENSAFGPTKNPWDLTRVPGGTSGGSAAAVASGMSWAALGSDTGGSIRQPAAFCGVVGFKPTYGAVSRYGLIAMASSLDQIGPITSNVKDAQELFKVIAGPDPMDATTLPLFNGSKAQKLKNKKPRVGIAKEHVGQGLSKAVKTVFDQAVKQMSKIADIEEISLPHSQYALASYYLVMFVEVAANLARFDGIKYGYSAFKVQGLKFNSVWDIYTKTRAAGFGPEVKRRIILGTFVSSAGYADKFYEQGQQGKMLIKQDYDRAFEQVDFILSPVTPTTAFKIGEKVDDPLAMYLSDIYTVPANLAGVPALAMPAGLSDGLPVGVQLIGPQQSDWQLLDFAKKYEETLNFTASPNL